MSKRGIKFILTTLLVLIFSFGFVGSAFASGDSNQGQMPLEKARQVLEEKLVGLPGIAGIAHSDKTGEIIVFLENERAKGQVPGRFEGFLVRTEITGKFQAHSVGVADPVAPSQLNTVSPGRLGKVSPLIGGVSVSALAGSVYIYAGTLGMVTYDNKILSNAHVIAMNPDDNSFLSSGTAIVQPGTLDGGFTSANRVGALDRYIPIKFGRIANYADAAIATIDSGIAVSQGEQFGESGNYVISGTTTVTTGDSVRKSGRTSGVTESIVYLTNASVTIDYGSGNKAYFKDQIIILQPFSQSGDSGSAVDKGGKFVGLVFAGSDYYSIACKARYIIEGLGISIEPTTPPEPPTLISILVTPDLSSVVVTGTQQFTATGTYSDGSSADLTATATWTSNDPNVATITAGGLATGVSEGTVTITATSGLINDTATLIVTTAPTQPTIEVSIVNITTAYRSAGKNLFVWAIATVDVKLDGFALEGATVEGHWTLPTYLSVSATTNASGNVSIKSSETKNPPSGTTFMFVVDRIINGSNIYNITGISGSITWVK